MRAAVACALFGCRLRQSLQQYRCWLEEERKVSSDPVKHQEFLQVSSCRAHFDIWNLKLSNISTLHPGHTEVPAGFDRADDFSSCRASFNAVWRLQLSHRCWFACHQTLLQLGVLMPPLGSLLEISRRAASNNLKHGVPHNVVFGTFGPICLPGSQR